MTELIILDPTDNTCEKENDSVAEERSIDGKGGFFDKYPRFFQTSDSWASPNRLNERYKALIERHSSVLGGATVLDLGSHDGRWSFAALHVGAQRAVGLEGHADLVADADQTFKEYGIDDDRYRFVCGDLFETIKDLEAGGFDVVLCLGFLYVHNRHFEMMKQVARLAPKYLVLDVWILPFTNDPITYLIPHVIDEHGSARYTEDFNYPIGLRDWSRPITPRDGSGIKFEEMGPSELPEIMLIAYPSLPALEWLLAEAGFGELDYFDWVDAPITDWNDLFDYQSGRRVSLIARNLRRK